MCSDDTARNHPTASNPDPDAHSPAPAERNALGAGDDPAREKGGVSEYEQACGELECAYGGFIADAFAVLRSA